MAVDCDVTDDCELSLVCDVKDVGEDDETELTELLSLLSDDIDERDRLLNDDVLLTLDWLDAVLISELLDEDADDSDVRLELDDALVAELSDVTLLPDDTPELGPDDEEDSSSHSAFSNAHRLSSS